MVIHLLCPVFIQIKTNLNMNEMKETVVCKLLKS